MPTVKDFLPYHESIPCVSDLCRDKSKLKGVAGLLYDCDPGQIMVKDRSRMCCSTYRADIQIEEEEKTFYFKRTDSGANLVNAIGWFLSNLLLGDDVRYLVGDDILVVEGIPGDELNTWVPEKVDLDTYAKAWGEWLAITDALGVRDRSNDNFTDLHGYHCGPRNILWDAESGSLRNIDFDMVGGGYSFDEESKVPPGLEDYVSQVDESIQRTRRRIVQNLELHRKTLESLAAEFEREMEEKEIIPLWGCVDSDAVYRIIQTCQEWDSD